MSNLSRALGVLAALTLPLAAIPPASAEEAVTGELVIAMAENHLGEATAEAAILTDKGFVPVEGAHIENVEPGTHLTVRGVRSRAGIYEVRSFKEAPRPKGKVDAALRDPGNHQIIVMIVQPKGVAPEPTHTREAVLAMVNRGVDFWADQGEGVNFTKVTYAGEFASQYGCDNYWGLWEEAAIKAHHTYATGKHLMLILPPEAYYDHGCSYGLGTVGGNTTAGGWTYVSDLSTTTVAHELGHNLSLRHAQSFSDLVGETLDGSSILAYNDPFDVMGFGYSDAPGLDVGNVNARVLQRVGLLPDDEQVTITESSQVTLQALDKVSGTGHPRLAQVTDPTSGVTYYLEYRPKIGREHRTWSGSTPGVVIRVDNPYAPTETVVVDTKVRSYDLTDAALGVGEGWSSKGGGVHLVVTSGTDKAAVVHVNLSTESLPTKIAFDAPKVLTYRSSAELVAHVDDTVPGAVTFRAVRADGKTNVIGTTRPVGGTARLAWDVPANRSAFKGIKATFTPDLTLYRKAEVTKTVKFHATPTKLKVSTSGGTLTAKVTTAGGAARGRVKITAVNAQTGKSKRFTKHLKDGSTSLKLDKALPRGVHHLTVEYIGDKNLRSFRSYATATSQKVVRTNGAKKVAPKIKVKVSKADPRKATVKVTTKGGVATGKVVLKAKGKRVTATLTNGKAVVRLPGSKKLKWKATYQGSGPLKKTAVTFTRSGR